MKGILRVLVFLLLVLLGLGTGLALFTEGGLAGIPWLAPLLAQMGI